MSDEGKSPVEQAILDAMAAGMFDNLPGEGQALNLDKDEATPHQYQMAYKLLRDNDLAPEWIMHGRWLDEKQGQVRQKIRRGVRAYKGALADAERARSPIRKQQAADAWELVQKTLGELVERYNKEVLNYNIKVPRAVGQRRFMDLDEEVCRVGGPAKS